MGTQQRTPVAAPNDGRGAPEGGWIVRGRGGINSRHAGAVSQRPRTDGRARGLNQGSPQGIDAIQAHHGFRIGGSGDNAPAGMAARPDLGRHGVEGSGIAGGVEGLSYVYANAKVIRSLLWWALLGLFAVLVFCVTLAEPDDRRAGGRRVVFLPGLMDQQDRVEH